MENKKNRRTRTVRRVNNTSAASARRDRYQDEESRSLISYEGGQKENAMLEEDDEADNKHCCCLYPTAIMIYGILLWLLGILIMANILVEFTNKFFPWYYPFVQLLFALVFFAGLILIAIWMCNDSPSSRTGIKVAAWLILGSTVILIMFNVFYILNYNKHKKEGVKVGSGDDPEDYDEEDRGTYLLGYIIWGVVILVFDILFVCCAYNYAETFPPEAPEEEEEPMMDKKMEKEEKMEKMEEMMEQMMEQMMEKMEAKMEGEEAPGDAPEMNAEGGQYERRSNLSRRSVNSRTSQRSGQQAKGIPPIFAANDYPAQRRQAAFNDIETEVTPRGSFKNQSNYERGEAQQRVPFENESHQVSQVSGNDKKNRRKNTKLRKKN